MPVIKDRIDVWHGENTMVYFGKENDLTIDAKIVIFDDYAYNIVKGVR